MEAFSFPSTCSWRSRAWVTHAIRSLSSKCLPVWGSISRPAEGALPVPLGSPCSCHTDLPETFLHLEQGIFVLQEGHAETMMGFGEEYPGARFMDVTV